MIKFDLSSIGKWLFLGGCAIATGCTAVEVSRLTPKPTPSPMASMDASPSDPFETALQVGYNAAVRVQTARSIADWQAVCQGWRQAISLLESIPPSHPKQAIVAEKIREYQRNLNYALDRLQADRSIAAETTTPQFLVVAGGGSPANNEVAIENNVLYFQRILSVFGYDGNAATIFFANGNDSRNTVRYIDEYGRERFKPPEIPDVRAAATWENVANWLGELARQNSDRPLFFYFTGHGIRNEKDFNNNSMMLWGERLVSVREFASQLDRLPVNKPVVAVMAQCFAGSFANLIYESGNPNRPLAAQTRCGFFATVRENPAVGCTPAIDESTYEDYSTSFFAGLSGWSRTGEPVTSADYNRDGSVSYAEAHAFAKVDERTTDLPVSTSEIWLQNQLDPGQKEAILNRSMAEVARSANPQQRYVVESLARELGFNLQRSYRQNQQAIALRNNIRIAFSKRLEMELINIGAVRELRSSGNTDKIETLDRLSTCEAGTIANPQF